MKYLFALMLLLAAGQLMAQTTGHITVHKDPRIDSLIQKQIEINELTTRASRRFTQGYRILIINTNNRDKAIDAKAKIYQNFPALKAYLEYQAPFFKLKVGNFKERPEAEDFLEQIKSIFPNGAYVVRDIIEQDFDKTPEEDPGL